MTYITSALRLLESWLASSGRFSAVTIGQPTAPPESPAAAVFLSSGTANLLTMTTFQRERLVTIRIYIDTTDASEDVETALDEMVYDTEDSIKADLDLAGTDWILFGEVAEEFGYVEVGGRTFRYADLNLPLRYRA